MWGKSQKQSLTQGPDNERGKLAARHRREPPAVAARLCRAAEGERKVDSVWREVFLEVTRLNLEGSFWRGSGQRSVAGNPGLFKVVGRQEAQPGGKVGRCGDVRGVQGA